MIDYTRLANADAHETSQATIAVANGLQNYDKEVQLLAAAAFFLLLCEGHRVPAQEVFTYTKNMMNAEKYAAAPQFNAAKQYIEQEITNG